MGRKKKDRHPLETWTNYKGQFKRVNKNKTLRARIDLLEREDDLKLLYIERSENNFMLFIKGLVIDGQHGPEQFSSVMASYQLVCFEDLAPAIEAVRDGRMPPKKRFWIERTKKAAKDADLAAIAIWPLVYPKRPFLAQVGAGNKEQAAIVKARIEALIHWNPWLNDYIEVVKWEVRSKLRGASGAPLAKLVIMSSDISGAHGGTPDLLLVNELTHIDKWEFAENLMDNLDGVAQGVGIVATNAGYRGTPAEVWRNNALTSEEWLCHIWDRPAPWHDPKTIEDAKRRNTPSRYKRLWEGIWPSGKGDALSDEAIDQAFCLDGPLQPDSRKIYIKGLDLSIHKDHSAIVVLEVDQDARKIRTAFWRDWRPKAVSGSKKPEIDLMEVTRVVEDLQKKYPGRTFYDPAEAGLMVQLLRKTGVPMEEMTFSSPKNLTAMAESLIQVLENGVLECYDNPDGDLRRDFAKMEIEERKYGYRLEATRDEYGHADRGVALVIALPAATEALGLSGMLSDDTWLANGSDDGSPLTEDELEALPEALKAIYSME